MIVPALILFNATSQRATAIKIHAESMADYHAEFKEIRIDISHLPKGSRINIEGKSLYILEDNIIHETSKHEFVVFGSEALDSLQGDTLIIDYRLPRHRINGFELYDYANPKLTAYLTGNTLHIDYALEDTHVIILSIWSIAGQFDCHKDKGLLPEKPWEYSMGGSNTGDINIRVE